MHSECLEVNVLRSLEKLSTLRHHSNVILSSLRSGSQDQGNIIRYGNPRWTYIRKSGLSSESKGKEAEDAENKEKNQPDSTQKVPKTVLNEKIINFTRFIYPRRRDIRISDLSSKSENIESKAAKDEKNIQFEEEKNILREAMNQSILNITRSLNYGKKYIRVLGISNKSENTHSETASNEKKNSNQKALETDVKQNFMNTIAYMIRKRRDIKVSDSSGGSEKAELEAAKFNEKENYSDADEKVLEVAKKEKISNIIGNVNSRRRYKALGFFVNEREGEKSRSVKDETKIQSDTDRKVLKSTMNKSMKNIIVHLTSRMRDIQALSLFRKWKDAKSVEDTTKIQLDANRKVLKTTVKASMMNIIAHVNSRIRNIQALSLFSKWKDTESAESVKDKPKIQFDFDRKVLEATVKKNMKNVIAHFNSIRKNIGDLGLFSKWVDTKPQAVKDKKTIPSDVEQEIFMAAMKERIIELNKENSEKITKRPIDTDNKEQTIEGNKLKERAKDAVCEETATAKPVISQPIETITYDLPISSLKGQFITPSQVMSDFLLNPADLESLPKAKKKSSHVYESLITVYWREDVEAKALEVWGSREALLRELLKIELERKAFQQNSLTLERIRTDYGLEMGSQKRSTNEDENVVNLTKGVPLSKILIGSKFVIKYFVLLYVGTHSPYSLADLCNQVILAYGIDKCAKSVERFERRLQEKQETNRRRRGKCYRKNHEQRRN